MSPAKKVAAKKGKAAEEIEVHGADHVSKTRRIDVDAARAARREAKGQTEPLILVIGGQEITMPDEMSADAMVAFGEVFEGLEGDPEDMSVGAQMRALAGMNQLLEVLFGAEVWARIRAQNLSIEDLEFILDTTFDFYGLDLGK